MVPFHLRYTVNRRQRLAVELPPWLPCLAASLSFTVAVTYLSAIVHPAFCFLLPLPFILCRGFFVFLLELLAYSTRPVDVIFEADRFGVLVDSERYWLSLGGVFQVYRNESRTAWILLHLNGSILTIPNHVITTEQLDFLKGFALRAAAARKAALAEAELQSASHLMEFD